MNPIVLDVIAYTRQPHQSRRAFDLDALMSEAATSDPGSRVDPGCTGIRLQLDHAGILMVLRHLLAAARRTAGPSGEVRIGTRLHRRHVLVYVACEPSAGPQPAQRPVHARSLMVSRGSGLNLAIVQTIAEAHGGRLRLASSIKGVLLVVRLPLPSEG